MNIEEFRIYCLSKLGTSESMPFGGDTLVFKVGSKMFALTDLEEFNSINLKCNPEKAIELRDTYEGVTAGYHMSKKHWNTVQVKSDVNVALLKTWIDDSYQLVWHSLSKKEREMIKEETK